MKTKNYKVTGTRMAYFEVEVEAEDETDAVDQVNSGDVSITLQDITGFDSPEAEHAELYE